jgi:hypothetical protein
MLETYEHGIFYADLQDIKRAALDAYIVSSRQTIQTIFIQFSLGARLNRQRVKGTGRHVAPKCVELTIWKLDSKKGIAYSIRIQNTCVASQ